MPSVTNYGGTLVHMQSTVSKIQDYLSQVMGIQRQLRMLLEVRTDFSVRHSTGAAVLDSAFSNHARVSISAKSCPVIPNGTAVVQIWQAGGRTPIVSPTQLV